MTSTAPSPSPAARPRIDRLTVLNWLAFLAILGMTLGEGCAMQAAKRREVREARAACAAAVAGVALALGAPPGRAPSGVALESAPADCAP